MIKNLILLVEGNHDVSFLYKVLINKGFKNIDKSSNLNELMETFIIKQFPFSGDKLEIFNKIPYFFVKEDIQIAVISTNGENNILTNLDRIFRKRIELLSQISEIVIVMDGDNLEKDEKIKSILEKGFETNKFKNILKEDLKLENSVVRYEDLKIKVDYYVLPNNKEKGRLEDIILKGIETTDNSLLESSKELLEVVGNEYKEAWNDGNSKYEKALIGIVGNVIIPGSAISTSIRHKKTKWISEENRKKIESLDTFCTYIESKIKTD